MTPKKLRKKHGWTQTELAEKLGVSLRTVQNYEADGYPKIVELALKQLDSENCDK